MAIVVSYSHDFYVYLFLWVPAPHNKVLHNSNNYSLPALAWVVQALAKEGSSHDETAFPLAWATGQEQGALALGQALAPQGKEALAPQGKQPLSDFQESRKAHSAHQVKAVGGAFAALEE